MQEGSLNEQQSVGGINNLKVELTDQEFEKIGETDVPGRVQITLRVTGGALNNCKYYIITRYQELFAQGLRIEDVTVISINGQPARPGLFAPGAVLVVDGERREV